MAGANGLVLANAEETVVYLSARFPHVVKAGAAAVVDWGFVGAALGDSFFLADFAPAEAVDPNIETGDVVVVDLHGDGRSADV